MTNTPIDAYQIKDLVRSCTSKKKYNRETDARMAIQRREASAKVMLKTYKCRHCDGWHLSKKIGG